MTADTSRSALHDRTASGPVTDLVTLHGREADRLLAYLCSSDRRLGLVDAEAVCQQAFQEVRGSWPSYAPYSRPEVAVFAAAQRIVSGRTRPPSSAPDALTESAPDYWDRADVARLTVLQDSLDRLSPVPRRAVILREMCGFAPAEVAEVLGLPEPAVESARGDALRTLVPLIESGTANGNARRGPLSPEDFAALGRVLQHTDPRRIDERQRFAMSLAQPPAMTQGPAFGAGAPPAPGVPPAPPTAAMAPGLGGAGVTQLQPTVPSSPMAAPSVSAPPTTALGGGLPTADALFGATGPTAGPAGGLPTGGWMGGFGRRPEAAPAPQPAPPTTMTPAAGPGPMTGSLPLGTPGFGGPTAPPAVPQPTYAAPQPMYAAPPPTYAAPAPAPTYSSPPTYSPGLGGPTSLMPTSMRPGTTPLDAPGTFGDPNDDAGTPIFDSVSAWFASPGAGGSQPNHWASLQDSGWREASARAAASPLVAGSTGSGLPVRAPGANMVPSMAEAAMGMTRPFSREAPRSDPGRVRNRLDSFQQGVQTARQMRDHLSDVAVDAGPPSGGLSVGGAAGPTGGGSASRQQPAAPAPSGPPSGAVPTGGGEGDGRRGREGGFGAFYRDYLPQLLAALMLEGARPATAAQIAQDAMSEAYREWAQIDNPRDWTRQVALATWSAQRRQSSGADAEPDAAGPAPTGRGHGGRDPGARR